MAANRFKLRKTKKTILIVGEGETERAFLQHLKECFIPRHSDIHVKIECGSGGDPKSVLQKTIRLRSSRSYDECFVLIDSDRVVRLDERLKNKNKAKTAHSRFADDTLLRRYASCHFGASQFLTS